MAAKDAKEYLMQYRATMERSAEIAQHLQELKAEAVRLKDHEGHSVKLDAATIRYVDACNAMADELDRLKTLREHITALIGSVQNDKYRELLREIYISGAKLVRIAADRDQSYEHICRLHGEALCAVDALLQAGS